MYGFVMRCRLMDRASSGGLWRCAPAMSSLKIVVCTRLIEDYCCQFAEYLPETSLDLLVTSERR